MATKKDMDVIKGLAGGIELLEYVVASLKNCHFDAIEIDGYDRSGDVAKAFRKAFKFTTGTVYLYNLQEEDVKLLLNEDYVEFKEKRDSEFLSNIVDKAVGNLKRGYRELKLCREQFPILDFEIGDVSQKIAAATSKLGKNTMTEFIYGKSEYKLKTYVY